MQEIIYAELHTISALVVSTSLNYISQYCKSSWKTCYVVEGILGDTQNFWKFLDGIWNLWMISQKKKKKQNPMFSFFAFFLPWGHHSKPIKISFSCSFSLFITSSPKGLASDPEENSYFLCSSALDKQEFKLEMSEYRKWNICLLH